jgi:uncharacterized protein YqeY
MSLLKQIDEDLIKALKSRDQEAVTTLRGLKSDIKYLQINNQIEELTDDDVLSVLGTAAKRRKDSIEQFTTGGRDDLVAKETKELELIKAYLPEEMSEEAIEDFVKEAIAETGAAAISDLGNVMKVLMPKVKGKADGKIVNQIVRRLLSA